MFILNYTLSSVVLLLNKNISGHYLLGNYSRCIITQLNYSKPLSALADHRGADICCCRWSVCLGSFCIALKLLMPIIW